LPVDGDPLVSAPDAEPVVPAPPAAGPGPMAADTLPLPPTSEPEPASAPAPESDPEPSGAPKGQIWKMALVVVVFLAVVVVAFILGKNGGGKDDTAGSTSTTGVDTSPIDTSKWATFTDSEAGFTLKHPKDWLKLPTDGAERIVLQAGPESAAYVTVRNISAEAAPDVIQQSLGGVTYVEGGEPSNDAINGLPVVRDIFETPINDDSPDPGVAVRYFVVSKSKLFMIVFVTRPPEELNRLARTFKGVSGSFKVTSDDPAPEPSTTTAPGAGTTPTT